MIPRPEVEACAIIDALLTQAGWSVQIAAEVNMLAGRGVAIREFPLGQGYRFQNTGK